MKRTTLICLATLLSLTLSPSIGRSALYINEVNANTENDGPNSSDNGKEFFELLSDSGVESLSGLTFLVIEGDGGAAGTIDKAMSLDGLATGTNGLFLWRDSANVLNPAPNPATTIKIEDFSPDLENGSNTFALVRGFTGETGDDLDTDNDGAIDGSLPWSETLDAIGVLDSGSSDRAYGAALGFLNFTNVPFAADSIIRLANSGTWIAADINESISGFPGPYPLDDTQAMFTDGALFTPSTALTFNTMSPGNGNPSLVPEPNAALLLVTLALILPVSRKKTIMCCN